MKFRQQIFLFLLVLVIGSSLNDLNSQSLKTKPTRQSSFEAFSKGNYDQAYREFSELLLVYSKDPLYKYYSGVCLVELTRDPGKAVTLLQEAMQGAAAVKTLPADALFYLGRAQQMAGSFNEAMGYYNLYTEQSGKKAARELGVPEYIKQCNEKRGQITVPEIKPNEIANNDKVAIGQIENKTLVKEDISQSSVKEPTVKITLPYSYETILDEALCFQIKSDSLNVLTRAQKNELEKLPTADKPELQAKISENELLAASFQKSADQKYNDAQLMMNPQLGKSQQKEVLQISDTLNKPVPVVDKHLETFAYFEVLSKPSSDPNDKIIIDPEVPEGLIYRIQIAVFRNPVAPAYFKGITPVYGFKVTGADRTNYYAGMFRRSSDARKALEVVKAKGFKDAFVVALSGNKPVSADRAVILEREWGMKPFISMVKSVSGTPHDTLPPTLSFRVEVIRSLKPLKDEMVEAIKKMAGNRGLDIKPIDDGKIAYLIGKFITFESAVEYADLLIRNGYRESRVVAWLNDKEIPVETARQLFDNMG